MRYLIPESVLSNFSSAVIASRWTSFELIERNLSRVRERPHPQKYDLGAWIN
jgi:hypothetical protein